MDIERNAFLPDTSTIVDGRFYRLLEKETPERVILCEAVVAEIEHQANLGKAIGESGLEELRKIKALCEKKSIPFSVEGTYPQDIKNLDRVILEFARSKNAILVTGDHIQAAIAEVKGARSLFLPRTTVSKTTIEDFFDGETMSAHLKEGMPALLKKGTPGNIRLTRGERLDREVVESIVLDIIERARRTEDCFIELDEKGATVVQLKEYRIAVTRPPFSDKLEITAVKPLKKLTLAEYDISEGLYERVSSAEGILVAGSPGAGKSTFVQALAEFYKDQKKIVKTMEKPRDLQVSDDITQYTSLSGSMEKTADILLLVRPDYTVFDEMRKTSDFKIYADLRLSGVGMVGVVHAARAIDAIQRFIGRIELGMIPQLIDTVIFISEGRIGKVHTLRLTVKVPQGMTDTDLSRPVIEVSDFSTGANEYEIYSFGEQVVVIPMRKPRSMERRLKQALGRRKFEIEETDSGRLNLYVKEKDIGEVVGAGGKRISQIERKLGAHIDVMAIERKYPVSVSVSKKWVKLGVRGARRSEMLFFFVDNEKVFEGEVGKKGKLQVETNTEIGQIFKHASEEGRKVYAREG